MTEVFAVLPDQPLIGVFDLMNPKPVPESLPCDEWHVAGNSNFHRDSKCQQFIALCKQKLNRTKLPIYVGGTGYVHWRQKPKAGPMCWDLDELGRFVCVLDDIWFFQRYTNGDVMVWTPIETEYGFDWNSISADKLAELHTTLENLNTLN